MATQTAQSMISEVSICNQAIAFIAGSRITSLQDQSREAEWCNENYPFIRDAVIEERMWTFATDKSASETDDKDGWGQNFQHRLPEEWLAVYHVFSDQNATVVPKWEREGEFIVTDAANVFMQGTKRIRDTGKFSNLFVQALAARMAADMCIPFTENTQLQSDLWTLYQAKLAEATIRDRQGRVDFVNDVCQLAYNKVSGDRLLDNEQQNLIYEMMHHAYPYIRDAVLAEGFWRFAQIRLASTSVVTRDEMYVHEIPETWLAVWKVYNDVDNGVRSTEWTNEGGVLLTDEDDVTIFGVEAVTDTARFSPMFVQALATRIASEIAIPVTQQAQMQERMWALYQAQLDHARVYDSAQGSMEAMISSGKLVEVR